MMELNAIEVRSVLRKVHVPTRIKSKVGIENISYTANPFDVPKLYIRVVFTQKKRTWFHKLFRFYTYDIVGIETPAESLIVLNNAASPDDVRYLVHSTGDRSQLDKKKFKLEKFKSLSEIQEDNVCAMHLK